MSNQFICYIVKIRDNAEKWIRKDLPIISQWLGRKITFINGLLQYWLVAYPTVVLVNIVFFQIAAFLANKIYNLFPPPQYLEKRARWLKTISVTGTLLSTYTLSNIEFIKMFRPAIPPFFYAAISTAVFIVKSYIKISKNQL